MKKAEGLEIVEEYLQKYRQISYSELIKRIGEQETFESKTEKGEQYQIEIDFMFDDESTRNLRVVGMVSYNSWTDFSPVSSDFIISPNGKFIGEKES